MTEIIKKPVPLWNNLPKYVQKDLTSVEIKKFDTLGKPFDEYIAELRLSILDLYVKLHGTKIVNNPCFDHIKSIKRIDLGVLDFIPKNINDLKKCLTMDMAFSNPSGDDWDSRERKISCSVHFKHKAEWGDMVSVHIDPIGLLTSMRNENMAGAEVIVFALPHLICYYHYKKVEDIRSKLLLSGWDPQPLLGTSSG